MDFQIGQRVADYEIVDLAGVGGMGRVYRVRNIISHRIEAMKVLLSDLKADPELASRFLSEIRTLATLDHPNIAKLHTAMQAGNELVMMMEYVEGSTLQQLAQQAPIPPHKIVDYMHQVLAALSFAHSRGVIHRDIKPANIMVTPTGMVKLTDFGIAKSKVKDELTRPGTTVGSLNYMSPEQALGGGTIDGRADLYSLGITMYELLAGQRPFEDESAYVVLHRQLNAEPRPPVEINPLLSQRLSDLILKALEKDPPKRFQNAAEFSQALRDVTGISALTPVKNYIPFSSGSRRLPTGVSNASKQLSTGAPLKARAWMVPGAALVAIVLAALGTAHFMKPWASTNVVNHAILPPAAIPIVDAGQTTLPSAVTKPVNAANIPVITLEAGDAHTPLVAGTPQPGDLASRSQLETPPPAESHGESLNRHQPAFAPATSLPASPGTRSADQRRARAEYKVASLRNEALPASQGPAPSAATFANSAEIQQLREQTRILDARAATLRATVQHLKSQQEAAGDGLNQEVANAYVRMNAYLSAEKSDLEDGDAAAARDHLQKAESEENTLAKLFSQ